MVSSTSLVTGSCIELWSERQIRHLPLMMRLWRGGLQMYVSSPLNLGHFMLSDCERVEMIFGLNYLIVDSYNNC